MAEKAPFRARLFRPKNSAQDWLAVRTPFDYADHMREIARKVGGKWVGEWKAWALNVTPEAAQLVRGLIGHMLPAEDVAVLDSIQPAATVPVTPEVTVPADALPIIPGLNKTAWTHQRRGFAFALEKPGVMLAMEMGTGKTLTTIGLLHARRALRTVILCPKPVVDVWPREFAKHATFPCVVVGLKAGDNKRKLRDAQAAVQEADRRGLPVVVCINYEAAWRDPFAAWLLGCGMDHMVLDESHKIKSPGGRASFFCGKLAEKVHRRIALTGTPFPHSPLDIYAQYRALDPSIFGLNYHRFKTRYAVMGGFGGHEVKGYQNQDEFYAKYSQIAFRVKASDVLDLPPVIDEAVFIDGLSPQAAKIYNAIDEEMYAEAKEGTITAGNVLVRLLRLQQLTGGAVRFDGEDVVREVDVHKASVLEELMEGMGKAPVAVFARFTHDLDVARRIAADQGKTYAEISGRENSLDEFQQGRADVIGVNLQSGGAGIDLTRARYGIYYSMGYSLGNYEQSRCRLHRPGQTNKVTFYHLVVRGTVDEDVYSALASRKEIVEYILDGLKRKAGNMNPLKQTAEQEPLNRNMEACSR